MFGNASIFHFPSGNEGVLVQWQQKIARPLFSLTLLSILLQIYVPAHHQ